MSVASERGSKIPGPFKQEGDAARAVDADRKPCERRGRVTPADYPTFTFLLLRKTFDAASAGVEISA